MSQNQSEITLNPRQLWHVLVRNRLLILSLALGFTLLAAISSFLATPLYKSTCTISIERAGARLLKQDLTAGDTSWLDYQNFFNTQYRIISSNAVLEIAATQLNLPDRPQLLPAKDGGSFSPAAIRGFLSRLVSPSPDSEASEDRMFPYRQLLQSGLSVDPVRDSHLVDISFVSTDRKFSAEAANAVALAYQAWTLGTKKRIADQSRSWTVRQVADLQRNIDEKERLLQDYASRNNIITGEASTEASLQNYSELRNRWTQAQAEAAQAKGRLTAYSQGDPDSLEEVRSNPLTQSLAQDVSRFESTYRELLTSYGSEFPAVKSAKDKLDSARERLTIETQAIARKVVESSRVEYENRRRQAEELGRLYASAEERLGKFKSAYINYLSRKDEVDNLRRTLNEMLEKQNQLGLSADLGNTGHNVQVVDMGLPPRQIYKPKKVMNISLGLILGLFAGIGSAFLREFVDNTIKIPEDVRSLLGLPVLSAIPSAGETARLRSSADPLRPRTLDPESAPGELLSLPGPVSEAFRELRTAILLATPGHPPRSIMVTSCLPGDGKTTTSLHLALALAQLGRRVLLVDTDLRRPRLHKITKAPNGKGVSTFLSGLTTISDLIQPTGVDNVLLLTSGPLPPNPAELLDSARFSQLLEELGGLGLDHIIFDTPPLLSVVDPLLVGRRTEGTVLVVRSGVTTREAGKMGQEKLVSGKLTVLGVVVNAISAETSNYGYYYPRYDQTASERSRPGFKGKRRPQEKPRKARVE